MNTRVNCEDGGKAGSGRAARWGRASGAAPGGLLLGPRRVSPKGRSTGRQQPDGSPVYQLRHQRDGHPSPGTTRRAVRFYSGPGQWAKHRQQHADTVFIGSFGRAKTSTHRAKDGNLRAGRPPPTVGQGVIGFALGSGDIVYAAEFPHKKRRTGLHG